ncbi:MAG: TPM domain-containing protein [Bryobacteraceae bacterium]|nr:TPM domain-containing protein [Bryobacteraceae bacterium]
MFKDVGHLLHLTVLVLILITTSAFGADSKTLQHQGYVSDFAGVLDAAARQDLERYCKQVETSTGAQMAFVTLKTLDGEPVEYFANDLYRRWGIGKKDTDEGLLLLLVTGDHHSRLEVGRGLEPIITDGTAGELLRSMRPALKAGDFSSALGTAAHSLGQRIATAKGVTIDEGSTPRRRVREQPSDGFPSPILLGVIFLAFLFLMSRGRRGGGGGGFLTGMILGNMMSRGSSYGQGGGGFGGYDSGGGGGFGGFGGGDSGGGGASSDW